MNSFRKHKNKAGFTLIEIIVITLILGMLGVAALSSFISTSRTFTFLAAEKSIASSIRAMRSYAATNKAVVIEGEQITPPRYGVWIDSQAIKTFADVGSDDFSLDDRDQIIQNKSHNFNDTNYKITLLDSSRASKRLPATMFFEKGSSEMTIFFDVNDANEVLSKVDHKHISLYVEDTDQDIHRYIVIFQLSGLSEEFIELP